MPRESKPPGVQAGVRFEKAQKLAREGEKARADYEAAGRAADVNMARLKALDRDDLAVDMTWALYDLIDEGDQRITFRRRGS